jgi:hypothetical protein
MFKTARLARAEVRLKSAPVQREGEGGTGEGGTSRPLHLSLSSFSVPYASRSGMRQLYPIRIRGYFAEAPARVRLPPPPHQYNSLSSIQAHTIRSVTE